MMKLNIFLLFLSCHYIIDTNAFQCPSFDGFFENTQDKHSFYQCAHGIPHLMQCPAGLVWDHQQKVCDWATDKRKTILSIALFMYINSIVLF